ncbi:MAG: M23 family metallopeptidase [Thermodesulfobacteriota bacterium]|nr:M23 family metallopeptidase [Thermodesulfobacteriota bacterium]
MNPRWTILMIPSDNRGTKSIHVLPAIVVSAVIFIVFVSIFSVVAGYRLYTLRYEISSMDAIMDKNKTQAEQLHILSSKLSAIEGEMSDLVIFNRHLSRIAGQDMEKTEEIIGVGGSEAGSGAGKIRSAGKGDVMTDKILTRHLHSHMKQINDDIVIEKGVAARLLSRIERQRSLASHTPSTWPTRGWISSDFGWRKSPFTGRREFHKGTDIAARKGTPVYAPADGIVTSYGRNGGYGNLLVINHGYGLVSRYGHLSKTNVHPGQQVARGDNVAFIGSTGRSTGPHLHYEILVNGIHVNPQRYMLK